MSKPDSLLEKFLERTIFASRWLQAPLYIGLIIAQCVYVYQFFVELWHLIGEVIHPANAEKAAGVAGAAAATGIAGVAETAATETGTMIMLAVLGLIDVVMIANLLIMVIIGGYETFVSRLHLGDHEDQPEWLSHVNAGALKVKLATALVSISSIHLLKTFIQVREVDAVFSNDGVMWQIIIHAVFVLSAIALAWTDKVMMTNAKAGAAAQH
jgi:uncharacterized protein (TIGR00645 family)